MLQAALEEALKVERLKSEDAIKSVIERERDASQKSMEDAVQAERDKTRQLLDEQRVTIYMSKLYYKDKMMVVLY